MLCGSPKGTYLLSWERLSSADPQLPNLKVWDAKTGAFLHGFVQKNLKRESWPYLQWSHDEKYAFLNVTNEIRVFQGDAFSATEVRFIDKMRCTGLSTMSLPTRATTDSYLVVSFSPGSKDKPARASLHKYPTTSPPNATSYPAIVSKSLFQAEEVTVHWSPNGDAALIALQTSVDTSGESYYGSTTLHLMTEFSTDVVTVPLPNNSTGPVLDVAWMPNPTKPPCFAVISGRMPAMASLHNGITGEATFLFGNAHRNTICWAPHGRFVNIAGFGNLAGGMTFWDRNKLKAIPQYDPETGVPLYREVVASCTVGYGWSPDSRTFLFHQQPAPA
jgi:translation initiation factor 2A